MGDSTKITIDFRLRSMRSDLDAMEKAIAEERAELRKAAVGVELEPGFKPVPAWPSLDRWAGEKSVAFSFSKDNNPYRYDSPQAARERLARAIAADVAKRPEIEAAMAHNAAIVSAALAFCKRLGLPESESVPKPRGAGTHTVPAGWTTIKRLAPRGTPWEEVSKQHESWTRQLDEWERERAAAKARDEAAAAERERVARAMRMAENMEAERVRIREEERRQIVAQVQAAERGKVEPPTPTEYEPRADDLNHGRLLEVE